MLETVRKAGMKLLADTRNRMVSGQKLSSLDAFVVDVQMMIQADHYMSWGKSAVRSFVERARVQRAKSIMEELKRTKEREQAEAELRTFYIIVTLPIIFGLAMLYIACCSSRNKSVLPTKVQVSAAGVEKEKEKDPPRTMEDRLRAGKFMKSTGSKGGEKRVFSSATNRKEGNR